jgi:hypothetical protein
MRSTPQDILSSAATDIQNSQDNLFDTDPSSFSSQQFHTDNFFTDTTSTPQTIMPPAANIQSRMRKHSYVNPFNSALTMPIPGTKLAPEKFRGDFHKVKEFIQHYERLCVQNNVTLDEEKCDMLLRYCSRRERQTIQNIRSFKAKSWGRLREDILGLYDADLDTKRYKVKDVRNFSKKQKERKIRDLAGWKKYCEYFTLTHGFPWTP